MAFILFHLYLLVWAITPFTSQHGEYLYFTIALPLRITVFNVNMATTISFTFLEVI